MKMELKELYIAPEVEILCFKPIERLANTNWGISLANETDDAGTSITTPEDPDPTNGDM